MLRTKLAGKVYMHNRNRNFGVELSKEDAEYENYINSLEYDILANGKNFG